MLELITEQLNQPGWSRNAGIRYKPARHGSVLPISQTILGDTNLDETIELLQKFLFITIEGDEMPTANGKPILTIDGNTFSTRQMHRYNRYFWHKDPDCNNDPKKSLRVIHYPSGSIAG